MSKFAIGLAVLILALPAFAAKGVVTYRISGCDYFLVKTQKGYDLMKWFGGYDPHKGDTLVGSFEQFGLHELVDETRNDNTTVWVEDFRLSKDVALNMLAEKCE